MTSAIKPKNYAIPERLGQYLQGVQHFGITVKDMAKSVEFYTQVLGGQIVVSESELVGDTVQNRCDRSRNCFRTGRHTQAEKY